MFPPPSDETTAMMMNTMTPTVAPTQPILEATRVRSETASMWTSARAAVSRDDRRVLWDGLGKFCEDQQDAGIRIIEVVRPSRDEPLAWASTTPLSPFGVGDEIYACRLLRKPAC